MLLVKFGRSCEVSIGQVLGLALKDTRTASMGHIKIRHIDIFLLIAAHGTQLKERRGTAANELSLLRGMSRRVVGPLFQAHIRLDVVVERS